MMLKQKIFNNHEQKKLRRKLDYKNGVKFELFGEKPIIEDTRVAPVLELPFRLLNKKKMIRQGRQQLNKQQSPDLSNLNDLINFRGETKKNGTGVIFLEKSYYKQKKK